MNRCLKILCACLLLLSFSGKVLASDSAASGRMVMFVGFDISGSFKNKPYFDDSIKFAANYLYAHLKGIGKMEVPHSLFVGSIGGDKPNEPKTFYPIEAFQYKDLAGIEAKLREIFPDKKVNKFTDYNAFFQQVSDYAKNKKLVMKPITILMFSDGIPDAPKVDGRDDYRSFKLDALETLSRNVTIRLLYTDAVVGQNWQDKVPRKRIRIWTQDATVMKDWKSPEIYQPNVPFEKKERWFSWVKNNVDFSARVKRVN